MSRGRLLVLTWLVAALELTAQSPQKTVAIHHVHAHDVLFVIAGGGENALALAQDDGVVLIDPLPAGWGPASLQAIETISDQPVRTIINIRNSEEHLKANAEYPGATRIIAHANLAARAKTMAAFAGGGARFLPNEVFTDRLSLLDGIDRLNLHYFGPGRTDADVVAVFPMKGVAYLGDLFPSQTVPTVDASRGGSALTFAETLAKARALTGLKIAVPGREPPTIRELSRIRIPVTQMPSWSRFVEYTDFATELVTAIVNAKAAGKTSQQAVSGLALSERFKNYDMRDAASFADAMYRESDRRR